MTTSQQEQDKQLQLQNIAHYWLLAEQAMKAKRRQAIEAERGRIPKK